MSARRPLPSPPSLSLRTNQQFIVNQFAKNTGNDMYQSQYPYMPSNLPTNTFDEQTTTLRGGTLLHKGFYDLLAMIPTPSPSRFLWGPSPPPPNIGGPRYDELTPPPPPKRTVVPPPPSQPTPPVPLKKGRRISKDMVSHPTGFLYVSHHSHLPSFSYPFLT
jgi:protein-serine/threonine kinase